MTVALPILSVCGHETCILPSAVLSTHSGGFDGYTFRDLTQEIPGICSHWKREGIAFDGIYTGYLGSGEQIRLAAEIFDTMANPGCARIVDPAMADNGKLYRGFDDSYVADMRELCTHADVLIPNLTEACLLTGEAYREDYPQEEIQIILEKLSRICDFIVLTGVGGKAGQTGVTVYRNGKLWQYSHPKIARSYHGTGDIFASAFVGAWMQEKTVEEAVKIAADFTALAIQNTYENPAHWYGVKFETALPTLVKMLFDTKENSRN